MYWRQHRKFWHILKSLGIVPHQTLRCSLAETRSVHKLLWSSWRRWMLFRVSFYMVEKPIDLIGFGRLRVINPASPPLKVIKLFSYTQYVALRINHLDFGTEILRVSIPGHYIIFAASFPTFADLPTFHCLHTASSSFFPSHCCQHDRREPWPIVSIWWAYFYDLDWTSGGQSFMFGSPETERCGLCSKLSDARELTWLLQRRTKGWRFRYVYCCCVRSEWTSSVRKNTKGLL